VVGLQPARHKEAAAYRTISRYRDMKRHDISISLLGYDMITTFNESFVPLGSKQQLRPLAVIWHEAVAGRKREDIISAFHAVFTTHRDTPQIVLWLDSCAAQNKNWSLLSYLIYSINSNKTHTNTVETNYPELGHMFMSADSFHHRVELSMKHNFTDYEQCV